MKACDAMVVVGRKRERPTYLWEEDTNAERQVKVKGDVNKRVLHFHSYIFYSNSKKWVFGESMMCVCVFIRESVYEPLLW